MAYLFLDVKTQELLLSLKDLVSKFGFSEVLFMLEKLASDNADYCSAPWESIRKNLEDSFIEFEEYSLNSEAN